MHKCAQGFILALTFFNFLQNVAEAAPKKKGQAQRDMRTRGSGYDERASSEGYDERDMRASAERLRLRECLERGITEGYERHVPQQQTGSSCASEADRSNSAGSARATAGSASSSAGPQLVMTHRAVAEPVLRNDLSPESRRSYDVQAMLQKEREISRTRMSFMEQGKEERIRTNSSLSGRQYEKDLIMSRAYQTMRPSHNRTIALGNGGEGDGNWLVSLEGEDNIRRRRLKLTKKQKEAGYENAPGRSSRRRRKDSDAQGCGGIKREVKAENKEQKQKQAKGGRMRQQAHGVSHIGLDT